MSRVCDNSSRRAEQFSKKKFTIYWNLLSSHIFKLFTVLTVHTGSLRSTVQLYTVYSTYYNIITTQQSFDHASILV